MVLVKAELRKFRFILSIKLHHFHSGKGQPCLLAIFFFFFPLVNECVFTDVQKLLQFLELELIDLRVKG